MIKRKLTRREARLQNALTSSQRMVAELYSVIGCAIEQLEDGDDYDARILLQETLQERKAR